MQDWLRGYNFRGRKIPIFPFSADFINNRVFFQILLQILKSGKNVGIVES